MRDTPVSDPVGDTTTWYSEQWAEAAWQAAHNEREARCHHHAPCPSKPAPYGSSDPRGLRVHASCILRGCLDLHHELLARMMLKLDRHPDPASITNPAAYVRRVARTELVEMRRIERTLVGFPAKPTRSDGVAGRVEASLREFGGSQGEWLVTLFRILRSCPYTTRHVPGRWPIHGFAAERVRHFPDEADQAGAVSQEIPFIMRRTTTIAGQAWVYDNLILPLNAGGALPVLHEAHPQEAVDETHALMGRMLVEAYRRERAGGASRTEALEIAAVEVTGRCAPPVTAEVEGALDEIEEGGSYGVPLAG